MGQNAVNFAAVSTIFANIFGNFARGYYVKNKAKIWGGTKLEKRTEIFDLLSTTVISSAMLTGIAILGIYLLNQSFTGLMLDSATLAVLGGVLAGIVTYMAFKRGYNTDVNSILKTMGYFLFGGVLMSMITAPDRNWWRSNFSELGTYNNLTSDVFNLTLILTGLAIIVLTDYVFRDLKVILKDKKIFGIPNIVILKTFFVVMAFFFSAMGIFPKSTFHPLHNFFAFGNPFILMALILLIKKLVPQVSKEFLFTSYGMIIIMAVIRYLYKNGTYFNLTAFEIVSFAAAFGWIIFFLKHIQHIVKNHSNLIKST